VTGGTRADEAVAFKRSQVLVGLLGAVALLGLNVVQFLYVLNPDLRPDPNERLRASIDVLWVEPQVTREDYLRRVTTSRRFRQAAEDDAGATLPHLSRERVCEEMPMLMAAEGWVLYAAVTVEGLKHRRVQLTGMLYDASTRTRFEDEERPTLPPRGLNSPYDSFVETVFVRLPSDPGRPAKRYYAELELRGEDRKDGTLGTLLAAARSRPFMYFEESDRPLDSFTHCR
jgi:hypothetical protein